MNKTKCKATLLIGALIISSLAASGIGAAQTILEEYNAIRSMVLSLNLPKGAENSILANLDASKESYMKSNFIVAMNQLVALENYLNAQKGKHIPEQVAEQLLSRVINLREMIWLGGIQIIKIGVTYNHDYQGTQALTDIARVDINAWLEANRKPYRVDFFLKDNQGSNEVALANTQEFHGEGIDIIVGHPWSTQCEASLDYVNTQGMLLLSASSTSPTLEMLGDNLLRGCPPDRVQVKRILDFYEAKGIEAIVLLYVNDAYGQWMRDLFQELSPGQVHIISSIPYVSWERDFTEKIQEADDALSSYLSQNPMNLDAVAVQMVDYGEIANAIEALETGSYQYVDKVVWLGNEATAINNELLYRIGEQAVKHRLYRAKAKADEASVQYQSVATRYTQMTGANLYYYKAVEYDLYWIIVRAVLHAQSLNPMNVKATILEMYGEPSPLPQPMTSLTLVLANVMQGDTEPYDGISGDISFNEDGDRPDSDYDLTGYAWVEGQLVSTFFGAYDESTGTTQTQEVQEQPPEFVYIGITITNDADFFHTNNIALLAKTDINSYCTENQIPMWFDFILKNNKGDIDIALQNLVEFNQAGINLVNGHGWSNQCGYSLQYINENNMILFSHSSTSPSLANPDNLFRLTTNDFVQGKVLVDLYELHQKKAVIILYIDDIWGFRLADVIRTKCNERGIEVLSFTPYNLSNVDWAQTLADMEAILASTTYKMDEIGFEIISFSEAVQALQCLSEGDYPLLRGVDWYGSDGTAMSDDIANNVFDIASQVKLYSTMVAPIWDDPKFTSFSDRYRSLFNAGPGFYAAAQYDILRILADYVILEGTTATDAIKPHLETLTGYNGVSGISTLDENGDRIGANYDIWGYGYDGNNYGSVRFGYYDLATDTITMFPMPEPLF
jgi:branched-chain amino acid transport system substrate-binding protein